MVSVRRSSCNISSFVQHTEVKGREDELVL